MRGVSYSKETKTDKVIKFIKKQYKGNKTGFLTAIGFIVGFTVLGIFMYSRFLTLNESASDRLAAAYMFFSYGNKDQGLLHLNNAIVYAPNTPASYQARLVKADMFIDMKEYEQALTFLKETYEKGKPELIRPLALSRIIYLYDEQKDYANATLYSNEFISKFKDNFLIKDIYFGLARFYTLSGSKEDARRVYKDILINFPATAAAEQADLILKDIDTNQGKTAEQK
jgi:hypothetical protein